MHEFLEGWLEMLRYLSLLLTLTFFLSAEDRLWKASLIAHGAASGLDAASSWGGPERNAIIGSQFQWRGAAIKGGAFSFSLALQTRKEMKKNRKAWTVFNFAVAGAYSAVAIRNWRKR